MSPAEDQLAVMNFLWREAEMLDRHEYKPWLALWQSGGLYIIPTEFGVQDHATRLNIAYDNEEMRQARVKRLMSGFAMSSAPAARTVRSLSRFVLSRLDDGILRVASAMTLVEYKYERTRLLAADVEHLLVPGPEGFTMLRKTISLINADDHLHGIGYLF